MKVTVSLTIEMTDEQMTELGDEYGVGRSEIRAFVREHILTGVQSGPAGEFWTASLKQR